jgi:hypothetical protein
MRHSILNRTFQATTPPKGVNTNIRGQRYGSLTAEFADATGKRIFLHCICKRSIWIAAEALTSGTITSCGCGKPSDAYRRQQEELSAKLIHERTFRADLPKNSGHKSRERDHE